jgi:hypothetical protein
VGGQDGADLPRDLRFDILLAGRGHLDQAPDVAVQQHDGVEPLGAGQAGAGQRGERDLQPGHLVRAGRPGPHAGLDGPRMGAVAVEDGHRP